MNNQSCKQLVSNLFVFVSILASLVFQPHNFAVAMETPEELLEKQRQEAFYRQEALYYDINTPQKSIVPVVPLLKLDIESFQPTKKSMLGKTLFEEKPKSLQISVGRQRNPHTKEQRECYLFQGDKGEFPYCYSKDTFKSHLDTTAKIYDEAIQKIKTNAYRSLKPYIDSYINKGIVDSLLSNYLDPSNEEREINSTGSAITKEELDEIKYYMNLCEHVYTDYYTRDFVLKQNLESIATKLDQIIYNYNQIMDLESEISAIEKSIKDLAALEITSQTTTIVGQIAQTEKTAQLDLKELAKSIKTKYEYMISRFNNFEIAGREELLKRLELKENDTVQQKIAEVRLAFLPLRAMVEQEYGMYFEVEKNQAENEWKLSDIKKWVDSKIFLEDLRLKPYRERRLTPKGAVITSFLTKTLLVNDPNIKILDVGFRNQERYGSSLNDFMNALMFIKRNSKSSFESWGEVDYIAYIKTDPERKKDKLVIVYAGSNSQLDWGIDFTIGSRMVSQGLSVHAGIGWMFEASANSYQKLLMPRLENYYQSLPVNERPKEIQIDITGHSLGGGLAQIAAHYYKTVVAPVLSKSTTVDNITVKAYTFAAPAIISKNTKDKYEFDLGKDNIYRVWVTNDPVAVLSEAVGIQGGQHVGKSIPLYNLDQLEQDLTDLWGPHGAGYYMAFIRNLNNATPQGKQREFIQILNNYIKSLQLDKFKEYRKDLNNAMVLFDARKFPITISHGVAEHIIRYSPETAQFNPPSTIAGYRPDSPRAAGALSPRFIVEPSKVKTERSITYGKDLFSITAKFDFPNQRDLNFKIFASTDSSQTSIRKYLKEQLTTFTPTDKQVVKLSVGVCLAKRVFVTQYPATHSSRYFGHTLVGGYSHHQDTLTKMLAMCLKECATSLIEGEKDKEKKLVIEYLVETSEERDTLGQAREILAQVGLSKQFEEKSIRFDRFDAQDAFERWPCEPNMNTWKRPGKEVPSEYYNTAKKKHALDRHIIDQLFSGKIIVSLTEKDIETDNIYLHILEATDKENHYELLQNLLNYNEIQQSFVDQIVLIDTRDLDRAVSQIDNLCLVFKNNILDGAKEYHRVYLENNKILGKYKKWNLKFLEEDLDSILAKIKRDNLWLRLLNNSSEPSSDSDALQLEG